MLNKIVFGWKRQRSRKLSSDQGCKWHCFLWLEKVKLHTDHILDTCLSCLSSMQLSQAGTLPCLGNCWVPVWWPAFESSLDLLCATPAGFPSLFLKRDWPILGVGPSKIWSSGFFFLNSLATWDSPVSASKCWGCRCEPPCQPSGLKMVDPSRIWLIMINTIHVDGLVYTSPMVLDALGLGTQGQVLLHLKVKCSEWPNTFLF